MNEDLKTRLQTDLVTVRKERDKLKTLVLSTVLSELKNKEIEEGGALDDEGVRQVVSRAIKQRKDAASQMRDGGREDLAEKEESEARILQEYLPPGLDETEVRVLVRGYIAEGATQMGQVMGRLMPEIRGRFDGKVANQIVREELGG